MRSQETTNYWYYLVEFCSQREQNFENQSLFWPKNFQKAKFYIKTALTILIKLGLPLLEGIQVLFCHFVFYIHIFYKLIFAVCSVIFYTLLFIVQFLHLLKCPLLYYFFNLLFLWSIWYDYYNIVLCIILPAPEMKDDNNIMYIPCLYYIIHFFI